MRVSSLLGLSTGWLMTSVGLALDVGVDDLIFYPTLVLGLPAVFGLVMGIRKFRKASPPETLQLGRLIGFGILGIVLMTAATLGLITVFYWGQPLPQG
jgi:hypothetical protein